MTKGWPAQEPTTPANSRPRALELGLRHSTKGERCPLR